MVMKKPMKSRLRRARRVQRKMRVSKPLIQNQTHVFRRDGQIVRIQQTAANTVTLVNDGNGSCFLGSSGLDSMTNTIQWGNSFQFKLASVIDSADFTSLFDKYKIVGVKLKILYQANTASTGGSAVMPVINYAIDYDDNDVPANAGQVLAKGGAKTKILSADRPVNIYFKPKLQSVMYNTGVISTGTITNVGLSPTKAVYINSQNINVPHFGLKLWINNFYTPAGANNQIHIQPTYYLQCKETL